MGKCDFFHYVSVYAFMCAFFKQMTLSHTYTQGYRFISVSCDTCVNVRGRGKGCTVTTLFKGT